MTLADLNVLIAGGMLLIGVLGTALTFWRWLAGTLRAVGAETNTRLVILQTQIDLSRAQLNEFKLEVATHYASDDRLREMDAKVAANFDKLINRFDAFATDFNRIVGRMERLDEERGAR